MIINRNLQSIIEEKLFKGKIIILYGPRRAGKTTLVKKILQQHPSSQSLYLNCDEPDIREALTNKTSTELLTYFDKNNLIIIDEAQRVQNIGLTLKLIIDNDPTRQIIATGSSSFDLSNKITEPLTGRAFEYYLAPFSLTEIYSNETEANRLLNNHLIYGLYPEAVNQPSQAKDFLRNLYKNYLYKDVLEYQGLRNAEVIPRLLEALALQIGSQVSYTELASLLGIDQKTVRTYLRLLELAFVIFPLSSFSRNLRKEIAKSRKIYFWDLGVRNAIINNFNSLNLRNDTGELWENFIIVERHKRNQFKESYPNCYFWRTWTKEEIDYLEEKDGILSSYEIKWQKGRKLAPKIWQQTYPNSSFQVISNKNYWPFLS
jgi:uncharacterized protein